MNSRPEFLFCTICGNIIGLVENAGKVIQCCGETMEKIIPNTVDASKEKHIPVASLEGNMLTVTIGEVLHPMVPEHFIKWICVMTDKRVQRARLVPGDAPQVEFYLDDTKDVDIYAYCNIHGLWYSKL